MDEGLLLGGATMTGLASAVTLDMSCKVAAPEPVYPVVCGQAHNHHVSVSGL